MIFQENSSSLNDQMEVVKVLKPNVSRKRYKMMAVQQSSFRGRMHPISEIILFSTISSEAWMSSVLNHIFFYRSLICSLR
jgi:hypothetical protein